MSDDQSGPVDFSFSEAMRGYIAAGEHEYHEAEEIGHKLGDEIAFHVTITMDDIDAFLGNPDHPVRLTGTIESDRFGGTVPVDAAFNHFIKDDKGHREMRYVMIFHGADGHKYRLDGFKDVHNDEVIDFWSDTTRLYTTVRHEDDKDNPVVATGILYIHVLDLIPQVLSMHATHADSIGEKLESVGKFGLFFSE